MCIPVDTVDAQFMLRWMMWHVQSNMFHKVECYKDIHFYVHDVLFYMLFWILWVKKTVTENRIFWAVKSVLKFH